jgi:hypothetical protein
LENSTLTSLSRFKISDEHLVIDKAVKNSIAKAYSEGRCFEFYPDSYIIERINAGDPVELFRESFIDMANAVLDSYSGQSSSFREKISGDTRLFAVIINALAMFHRGAAMLDNNLIATRRIVLIKELPGRATFHHISKFTTVIAHVGQGPEWSEVSTIYLGLKIFETLIARKNIDNNRLFEAFVFLLKAEERAIEIGFSHTTLYPIESFELLNTLVDFVIEYSLKFEEKYKDELPAAIVEKFSEEKKNELIEKLNRRIKGNELNFDYEVNIAGIEELEKYAKEFKKGYDETSLRQIIKLLVAASGHDIHEIRNRANIALDRVFSPKEFDAPLATRFINISVNTEYTFSFNLPKLDDGNSYGIRIYKSSKDYYYNTEKNIDVEEIALTEIENEIYETTYRFTEYGHYDFCVVSISDTRVFLSTDQGLSGRINVLPNLEGEIIL